MNEVPRTDLMWRILRLAAVAALLVTFGMSIFVPIYSDEVTFKIYQSRLFHDGLVNITLFPQCGAFTTAPPWYMMPARVIDAVVYGELHNPLLLRVAGIATFLGWLGLALVLLRGALAVRLERLTLAGTAASFLGLGILPLLLVLNRPEQVLLIGLTMVLLAPFVARENASATYEALAATLGVCLLTLLLAVHPKVVLFFPLVVVGLFIIVRRFWIRAAALAALAYFGGASYSYWTARQSCPGDAQFAEALKAQFLQPSLLTSHPAKFLRQLAANAWEARFYVGNLRFRDAYPAKWLPSHLVPDPLAGAVNIGLLAVALALALLTTLAVLSLVQESRREGGVSRRLLVVGSCLASLLGLVLLQNEKSFYDSALLVPLAGLTAIVAIPQSWYREFVSEGRRLSAGLMGMALVSQVVLWAFLGPRIQGELLHGGYLRGQPNAFSAVGFEQVRTQILEAAGRCGIHPEDRPSHLVVDDLTYAVFVDSYQPFHIKYLRRGGPDLWNVNARPVGQVVGMLREWRSGGIVVGCHMLPKELPAVATGAFCCIPSSAFRIDSSRETAPVASAPAAAGE